MKIERAVISVSDKSGLGELGQFLKSCNVEIMSTGGTKKYLDEQGAGPIGPNATLIFEVELVAVK